jgi:hypothetical protein
LNPFKPTNLSNSRLFILNEQSIPSATRCDTRTKPLPGSAKR